MAPSNPLILVDGSSYLYRAFFASQQANLRTSTGLPSGAVRVMANMMRSLRKQYPDCHVAVVFDAKGKTFRDDIYPEYKATRASMPDNLRSQVAPIHQMIKAMGFPFLMVEGVEADDVIGTLARQATEKQLPVLISTGDKDMAQLVSDHVTLIDTMKDVKTDREGVIEKFGVPPELIIDYLALMGDKVDNIPGMTGVGEKTALALLQGIGSIDEIAANLDKVAALGFRGSKAFADKFREQEEQVRLSYRLATIKTDVELEQSLEELLLKPVDKESLLAVYREYELRNLIKELESGGEEGSESAGQDEAGDESAAPVAAIETDYRCILDEAEFDGWLEQLKAAPLFAFDTETTSLDYMEARIVGVSFAVEPGKAAYVPFGHDYLGAPVQLSEAVVLGKLKPLLEDPTRLKVGQNLKYDRNVLLNHDIDLQGIAYDTMLESYVLNSTASRHDMDSLAKRYLGVETTSFEDIAGKGVKQLTFNQIELEQATPYAAEDADITLRLHQTLWGSWRPCRASPRYLVKSNCPCCRYWRGWSCSAPLSIPSCCTSRVRRLSCGWRSWRSRLTSWPDRSSTSPRPSSWGDPLHQAGPADHQKDSQGSAVHRRRGAGRAGGDLRAAASPDGTSRSGQAQVHLYRQAAVDDQAADRAGTHLLSSGGGGYGPFVII